MTMAADRKVALVTGASRGIGKACAAWLARSGFDCALSARTLQPGEAREHSPTVQKSDTRPLPGSLSETAALVTDEGHEALLVPADLLDAASLGFAVATVLERWGRIDVLVNNGRYIGPGHMDRFLDTPIDLLEKQMYANCIAPLVLAKAVLPGMVSRGSGTIVNITSASGYSDPTAPAGAGGWGMGYGISKGAIQRVAGFLKVELGDQGVRSFGVQPGFISTERMAMDMADFGFDGSLGAPPDVVGAVVAWLCTSPEADALNGQNVEAQFFCHERGLLKGWPGPRPTAMAIGYDLSAAKLAQLEEDLAARSRGE
jgi:NAD(P)-dependent dehydrogenase (short-subunit alcohol dehydrogenase family)